MAGKPRTKARRPSRDDAGRRWRRSGRTRGQCLTDEERRDPLVRPFNQAPALAPARKVKTKPTIVNVFIAAKQSYEEKVPAPLSERGDRASAPSSDERGTRFCRASTTRVPAPSSSSCSVCIRMISLVMCSLGTTGRFCPSQRLLRSRNAFRSRRLYGRSSSRASVQDYPKPCVEGSDSTTSRASTNSGRSPSAATF
jgi:hypothetical protein